MCRPLQDGHPPPSLAGQRDDEAPAAAHAQGTAESEAEQPALEIAAEFLFDVSRHGPRGKRGGGSDHGQAGGWTRRVIARTLFVGYSPPPVGHGSRAAVILRQLLNGPILVVPFMRIDGKRVVPRLEFTINLVAALPSAVAGPLRQAAAVEGEPPVMLERPLVVNAFAEPQLVKHARVIVERRLAGKTYKEIAQELDLTEYHMENCAAIVRLMEAAGLAEPYRRLNEKPDHVPQWCSKHWLKAGDRRGGGKRRRAS